MSLGVVMLVHRDFHRVAQLAARWAEDGSQVVIHVDTNVPLSEFDELSEGLAQYGSVKLIREFRCEWGTWGIVAATQSSCEKLLREFPDVSRVVLTSGSCMPLRPPSELAAYLRNHPDVDFIESVAIREVPWIVDGLGMERFTLWFPYPWKSQQKKFDHLVEFQRAFGVKRRIPAGISPHIGSQWWCLTRETLLAILTDPRRQEFDRYFQRVWIPDESYFQTLARLHSNSIESRSLTLSKFDPNGRPVMFYDDHYDLLRRTRSHIARKIWPKADKLWDYFLNAPEDIHDDCSPPGIDGAQIFANSQLRVQPTRRGLYMQSRHPTTSAQWNASAGPYCVFEGFDDLFTGFPRWFNRATDIQSHGHIFSPSGAEFANGHRFFAGALPAAPLLRDYNAVGFLHNLLWNTRGQIQSFQFGPADTQKISTTLASDPNAYINIISGAWIVPLYRQRGDFEQARTRAAQLQKIEADHIAALTSPNALANVRIWSLADFIDAPVRCIEEIFTTNLPIRAKYPGELPPLRDLTGVGRFLRELKNQGMYPHLMGNFRTDPAPDSPLVATPASKPDLER